MGQRGELMRIYIKGGYRDLNDMKKHYNEFSEGGNMYDGNNPNGQQMSTYQKNISQINIPSIPDDYNPTDAEVMQNRVKYLQEEQGMRGREAVKAAKEWDKPAKSMSSTDIRRSAGMLSVVPAAEAAGIGLGLVIPTPEDVLIGAALKGVFKGAKAVGKGVGKAVNNKYIDLTTVPYYHGGLPSNATVGVIDVMRPAVKQGKNYAGFYMNKGSDLL